MIARLVEAAVRHRVMTLALTAALAVAAGLLAVRLKLDALPDLTNNQVLVLTRAPGLTPDEVERRVTRPIEVALGGLPGIVQHRSLSRYGISSITVVFDDGVDPWRARQLVQERLTGLGGSLPTGVDLPELGPATGGLGEVFHFTLRSPSRTASELYELATFRVAPLLRSVPGVVEVNTWGGRRRTLEVTADPVRLAARGLTLEDLRAALGRATGTAPGASLPAGTGQALLRVVALVANPSELGEVVIRSPRMQAEGGGGMGRHAGLAGTEGPGGSGGAGGARGAAGASGAAGLVRLADVAHIAWGSAPRIGAATAEGHGETVYVMAQMLRGDNALEVVDAIHARMPALRAALPGDVRLDLVYDRSQLVTATLHTVGKNLAEGGALVIAVLFVMLGSLRAGLLVALVIPLSMLGAGLGMVLLGIPGNLMSLGAIDFGLVVDGAVVMVEHVFRALHPRRTGGPNPAPGVPPGPGEDPEALRRPLGERVAGVAREVASPVFFSVLVILLVYVPVVSLTGVDGKMFRPMALTVVMALFTSLVLSLTFIPAAAALVLRPRDIPARDPLAVRLLDRVYGPLLDRAQRHPLVVALGAVALLVGGAAFYWRAGSEFAPQLDEGDLVIQVTRDPDISLEQAVREAGRLERVLREEVPEVRQVVSRVGSPAVATDIMGIEQADVFVSLAPRARWRPGLTREALIAEMAELLAARAPGGEPAFTQPIQMRFNELLGGAVTDVAVSVYGEELDELRRLAEAVRAEVARQPGAADTRVLAPPDVAVMEVRPRPLPAAQYGYAVSEVLDAVQAVRQGVAVGVTYDGPVRIPIVLRLGGVESALELGELPLPTASGGVVPLGRLAEVVPRRAPGLVSHQDGQRRLVVGFNVRGADLGPVVQGAQARVAAGVQLPAGYRIEWGGQYEQLEEATRRLMVVIPMVVVLILTVLLLAFRRLGPALLIFTNVPFACVGGMMALGVRGMAVSVSAAVGFIALSGVAVLNGVVLMSRVLSEEAEGRTPAEAALGAARERARPVLMTALVAALGFVPMMLARGVGAEVQRPLATVVVGGLVTSTLLTLIILPTAYARLGPWLQRWRAGRSGRTAGPPLAPTPAATPAEEV
ncbi:MAG TPA: efflux RND transporter permease subunit [Polyangia bacterium]|nr:efflux RND transporter permease subunit [Polyangia bacterium]